MSSNPWLPKPSGWGVITAATVEMVPFQDGSSGPREAARAFRELVGGNANAARDVMQARRDAFMDDRSQSAVERLTEMADRRRAR